MTIHENSASLQAEDKLWSLLEMDEIGERMAAPVVAGADDLQMGTGHTHNACYMCSNSATTHGCGTCSN